MMRRFKCFVANGIIFLSALWTTIGFFLNLSNFRRSQDRKLKSLCNKNRDTVFLGKSGINGCGNYRELPVTDWKDYESHIRQIMMNGQNVLTKEEVIILEPTSGTTTHTKYIPYTRGLQREFNRAIQPWLAGLYLYWPSLFFSSQYWSISPATQPKNKTDTLIPVGFETDSQYLGDKRGMILDHIMAVPKWVRNITGHENWSYITVFFLVSDKNLGLISVWHPSYLIILLEKIKKYFPKLISDIEKGHISIDEDIRHTGKGQSSGDTGITGYENLLTKPLPGSAHLLTKQLPGSARLRTKQLPGSSRLRTKPLPGRARELELLDINSAEFHRKLWPRLKVISCWADDKEESSLVELQKIFPYTYIQPKGLIATEGIISFPFGRSSGLTAYRSHVLEFIDLRNDELKALDKIELHREYEPVISTGGGLYRYRMNDVVKVTGFFRNKLPQLQFMYKRDYVSDIRGEKVHLQHVYEIQARVRKEWQGIRFFMLAPVVSGTKAFYCCYIFRVNDLPVQYEELAGLVDESLENNFQYQHARQTGQLAKPGVFLLEKDPVADIISHIESTGIKRGDIKLLPLSRHTAWHRILKGRFIVQDT